MLLTADLPTVTEPITIQGQGMGSSTVDGDNGNYKLFNVDTDQDVILSGFTASSFKAIGLTVNNANLTVDKIEFDGTNAIAGAVPFSGGQTVLGAVNYQPSVAVNSTVNLSNIYVHNLAIAQGTAAVIGIRINIFNGANTQFSADRITIAGISSTGSDSPQVQGLETTVGVGSTLSPNVLSNTTITNITSTTSAVSGAVSLLGNSFGEGINTVEQTLRNVTITGFRSTANENSASSLLALGLAAQETDGSTVTMQTQNVLIADSIVVGQSKSCTAINANPFVAGLGSVSLDFPSQGGNLSDDNSCKSYFTKSTDQNNVPVLADTLSPLADNGGYVPTMALKKNSPAIDAGVTVADLTTDARGSVRPQGNAYDSGAYESPYTKPKAKTASLASTGENTSTLFLAALSILGLGLVTIALRRRTKA